MELLKRGDVVVVTRELLNLVHAIGEAGAAFPINRRRSVGHKFVTRPFAGDIACRDRRFRARPDQEADRRWLQARHGARSSSLAANHGAAGPDF